MLTQETLQKMNAMKLFGMVAALEQQLRSNDYHELAFEERVGMLVDAEWTDRERRKLSRRLTAAKLRYPASLENVDFRASRGLDRQQVLTLGSARWIAERHNLLVTGPTGIGKSFLACAFVERACRRGFTGYYVRAPRLLHDLAVARGDGSYARLLTRLAKLDLLAIDDWLLHPLKDSERRDLMEVIEDRAERGSTLVATQLPVKQWHTAIGDPNQRRRHLRSSPTPRAPHHPDGPVSSKDPVRPRDQSEGPMISFCRRWLREREGGFASYLRPAPYATADKPVLVHVPHTAVRSPTTERRSTHSTALR